MRDYSPADSADYAEECSGAALFRRERQFDVVHEVIAVWVLSARSAGDIGASLVIA